MWDKNICYKGRWSNYITAMTKFSIKIHGFFSRLLVYPTQQSFSLIPTLFWNRTIPHRLPKKTTDIYCSYRSSLEGEHTKMKECLQVCGDTSCHYSCWFREGCHYYSQLRLFWWPCCEFLLVEIELWILSASNICLGDNCNISVILCLQF